MKPLVVAFLLLFHSGATPANTTLFDDLGGMDGLNAVTRALLERLFDDQRIAFLFEETDREDLHERVVEQLCAESGGPCEYTGLPMDEAHSGQEIKHKEFDIFVEHLIIAMENVGVPYRQQNRLLKIFAPMRADIVYR